MADIEVGFATNGPEVMTEVERSLRGLEQLFDRPQKELNLGQFDVRKLNEYEAALRRLAQTYQQVYSATPKGGRAELGVQIGNEAARIAATFRPQLSALGQSVDLATIARDVLRQELRAGNLGFGLAGRGGQQGALTALSRAQRAADLDFQSKLGVGSEAGQDPVKTTLAYRQLLESSAKKDAELRSRAQGQQVAAAEEEAKSTRERTREADKLTAREQKYQLDEATERARQQRAAQRAADAQAKREQRYQLDEAKIIEQKRVAAEKEARATAELAQAQQLLAAGYRHQGAFLVGPGGAFRLTQQGRGAALAPDLGVGGVDAYARLAYNQAQTPLSSFMGGLFGKSFTGVNGPLDTRGAVNNLATSAGTTLKYATLYSTLSNVQQVIGDTLNELKDYSEGVRDLEVAMGDGAEAGQRYLQQLGEISRLSGGNPSAAAEAAARGIRAFTRPGDSAETIQNAGQAVAEASTQISLITGKDLKNATGDVVAIASAYGLAATQAREVVDALAGARAVGGDPAETSQGLANVAQVAKEAGFNLQEAANAISLVSARVDESGQAAATRISRIITILGGTTGRGIIEKINQASPGSNIDPTASARDQLAQIAKAYNQAGTEGNIQLQGLIQSALGGTSNSRELQVLFQNSDRIFGATATAGSGQAQFEARMNTLDGLLKRITGDLTNIQVQLGSSDIFAPLAAGLRIFEAGLHTLERFLALYNELTGIIPEPFRGIATTAAEVLILVKSLERLRALAGPLGLNAAAGLIGGVQAASAGASARSALGLGQIAAPLVPGAAAGWAQPIAQASGGVAAGIKTGGLQIREGMREAALAIRSGSIGGVGGGLAKAGGGLMGLLGGPVGLAIIGSLIGVSFIQQVRDDMDEIRQIRQGARDAARQAIAAGDYKGAADAMRSAQASLRQGGGITGWLTAADRDKGINSAGALASTYTRFGLQVDAEKKLAAARQQGSVLGDLATQSAESLNSALDELQKSGQTATTTAVILSKAIADMLNPPQRDIQVEALSAGTASGLVNSAGEFAGRLRGKDRTGRDVALSSGTRDALIDAIGSDTVLQGAQAQLERLLKANGGKALTGEKADQIAKYMGDYVVGLSGLTDPALKAQLAALVANKVRQDLADQGGTQQSGPLSQTALLSGIDAALSLAGNAGGGTRQQIATWRRTLGQIDSLRSQASGDDANLPSILQARQKVLSEIAKAQVADDLRLLKALDKRDPKAAKAKSQQILQAAVTLALDASDEDQLISIIEQANAAQIAVVRQTLQATIDVIAAAIMQAKSYSSLLGLAAQWEDAKGRLAKFNAAAKRSVVSSGKDNPGYGLDKANQGGGTGDTAIDIANARREAIAAQSRNPVVVARAALESARANVSQAASKEGRNSVAYWNAVKSYYEVRKGYADAVQQQALAQRAALERLHIDLTDPVATAAQDLREARRKLASDVAKGADRTDILNDQLDVKQKQTGLEAAKFQQRMSDMQIADELGRISHAAYIRYLQNEHDRLSKIKNKTRQQIDELNDVDQALKSAMNALQGQFNLGDIKLPTVYEMRRALVGGGIGSLGGATQNVVINVDGADTAQILRLLSQYVGQVATGTTTITSRRA